MSKKSTLQVCIDNDTIKAMALIECNLATMLFCKANFQVLLAQPGHRATFIIFKNIRLER